MLQNRRETASTTKQVEAEGGTSFKMFPSSCNSYHTALIEDEKARKQARIFSLTKHNHSCSFITTPKYLETWKKRLSYPSFGCRSVYRKTGYCTGSLMTALGLTLYRLKESDRLVPAITLDRCIRLAY